MNKCQIALEYLIIFSFSLIVIIGLAFAWSYYNSAKNIRDAKNTLDVLGNAADMVYNLGAGSIKNVPVNMPSGIEEVKVEKNEIMFVLNEGGKHGKYTSTTKSPLVKGYLPTKQGRYEIPVEKLVNGSVRIGFSDDKTPPIVVATYPSGTIFEKIVTLGAVTDEYAECKFDTEEEEYELMNFTFEGQLKVHEWDNWGPLDVGSHVYYVRCTDLAGNAMTESAQIKFIVADSYECPPDYNFWHIFLSGFTKETMTIGELGVGKTYLSGIQMNKSIIIGKADLNMGGLSLPASGTTTERFAYIPTLQGMDIVTVKIKKNAKISTAQLRLTGLPFKVKIAYFCTNDCKHPYYTYNQLGIDWLQNRGYEVLASQSDNWYEIDLKQYDLAVVPVKEGIGLNLGDVLTTTNLIEDFKNDGLGVLSLGSASTGVALGVIEDAGEDTDNDAIFVNCNDKILNGYCDRHDFTSGTILTLYNEIFNRDVVMLGYNYQYLDNPNWIVFKAPKVGTEGKFFFVGTHSDGFFNYEPEFGQVLERAIEWLPYRPGTYRSDDIIETQSSQDPLDYSGIECGSDYGESEICRFYSYFKPYYFDYFEIRPPDNTIRGEIEGIPFELTSKEFDIFLYAVDNVGDLETGLTPINVKYDQVLDFSNGPAKINFNVDMPANKHAMVIVCTDWDNDGTCDSYKGTESEKTYYYYTLRYGHGISGRGTYYAKVGDSWFRDPTHVAMGYSHKPGEYEYASNLKVDVLNDNHLTTSLPGALNDTAIVELYEPEIEEYMQRCIPDEEGYCTIDIALESDTKGYIIVESEIQYEGKYIDNVNVDVGCDNNYEYQSDGQFSGQGVIDEFSDGSKSKDLIFNAAEDIINYVQVPKNSKLKKAWLYASGTNTLDTFAPVVFSDTDFCGWGSGTMGYRDITFTEGFTLTKIDIFTGEHYSNNVVIWQGSNIIAESRGAKPWSEGKCHGSPCTLYFEDENTYIPAGTYTVKLYSDAGAMGEPVRQLNCDGKPLMVIYGISDSFSNDIDDCSLGQADVSAEIDLLNDGIIEDNTNTPCGFDKIDLIFEGLENVPVDCNCNGCQIIGTDCKIPLRSRSNKAGSLRLSKLLFQYEMNDNPGVSLNFTEQLYSILQNNCSGGIIIGELCHPSICIEAEGSTEEIVLYNNIIPIEEASTGGGTTGWHAMVTFPTDTVVTSADIWVGADHYILIRDVLGVNVPSNDGCTGYPCRVYFDNVFVPAGIYNFWVSDGASVKFNYDNEPMMVVYGIHGQVGLGNLTVVYYDETSLDPISCFIGCGMTTQCDVKSRTDVLDRDYTENFYIDYDYDNDGRLERFISSPYSIKTKIYPPDPSWQFPYDYITPDSLFIYDTTNGPTLYKGNPECSDSTCKKTRPLLTLDWNNTVLVEQFPLLNPNNKVLEGYDSDTSYVKMRTNANLDLSNPFLAGTWIAIDTNRDHSLERYIYDKRNPSSYSCICDCREEHETEYGARTIAYALDLEQWIKLCPHSTCSNNIYVCESDGDITYYKLDPEAEEIVVDPCTVGSFNLSEQEIYEDYCRPPYEEWTCTEWGACINFIQTRECVDEYDQGFENFKPETERECGCIVDVRYVGNEIETDGDNDGHLERYSSSIKGSTTNIDLNIKYLVGYTPDGKTVWHIPGLSNSIFVGNNASMIQYGLVGPGGSRSPDPDYLESYKEGCTGSTEFTITDYHAYYQGTELTENSGIEIDVSETVDFTATAYNNVFHITQLNASIYIGYDGQWEIENEPMLFDGEKFIYSFSPQKYSKEYDYFIEVREPTGKVTATNIIENIFVTASYVPQVIFRTNVLNDDYYNQLSRWLSLDIGQDGNLDALGYYTRSRSWPSYCNYVNVCSSSSETNCVLSYDGVNPTVTPINNYKIIKRYSYEVYICLDDVSRYVRYRTTDSDRCELPECLSPDPTEPYTSQNCGGTTPCQETIIVMT